jgi:hypothetical protein
LKHFESFLKGFHKKPSSYFSAVFLFSIGLLNGGIAFAQNSIQAARLAGAGQVVTINGIVTNGPEFGNIRYVQDSTAGIGVYSPQVSSWMPGDSIQVTGTLSDYFGLLEIGSISNDSVLKSGANLPKPKRIQIAELGENYEGQLVTLKKTWFPAAGIATVGGSTYVLRNATDSTNLYIRNGSPLAGITLPSDTLDVTGICSQYTQYQLLARSLADFSPFQPDSVVTSRSVTRSLSSGAFAFPNPLTGNTLQFSFPEMEKEAIQSLSLISSDGRAIRIPLEKVQKYPNAYKLDAASWPTGILVLRVQTGHHSYSINFFHP